MRRMGRGGERGLKEEDIGVPLLPEEGLTYCAFPKLETPLILARHQVAFGGSSLKTARALRNTCLGYDELATHNILHQRTPLSRISLVEAAGGQQHGCDRKATVDAGLRQLLTVAVEDASSSSELPSSLLLLLSSSASGAGALTEI